MIFSRVVVASVFAVAALATAPSASAQSTCRSSCDRTFQACSRNAPNSTACMSTWHACKRYCRSGAVTPNNAAATRAPMTPRNHSAQPPRVTGPRSN